jgi:sulfotransferase famil protein
MVIRVDPLRLAYMAVPKAACSSVKATLAALDPAVEALDPARFGQKKVHALYPTQRFRKHRWDRVTDFFRFTVVRDPFQRLLSVYTHRVVALGELRHCRKIRRGRVNLPADPDPDFFFQNLAEYAAVSSAIKHHVLPTVVFTGADLGRYDKVYRTDDLDDLGTDLSSYLGCNVSIPHFKSSAMSLTLDDLNPRTHCALKARLDHEYNHLADFFSNPFDRQFYLRAA